MQSKLPPWWGNTLSAMSLVWRRAIRGAMELMTCCSCDRPPGPRLLSAAAGATGAVGARGSATGQTQRRRDCVYFGRRFGAGHPVCSPSNLYTPPPPSSHTHNTHTPYHQHTRNEDTFRWRHEQLLTQIRLKGQFIQIIQKTCFLNGFLLWFYLLRFRIIRL